MSNSDHTAWRKSGMRGKVPAWLLAANNRRAAGRGSQGARQDYDSAAVEEEETVTENESRPWTADELAAELYRRQGYFLVASNRTLQVGEFLPWCIGMDPGLKPKIAFLSARLRVVGFASRDEFEAQDRLADEITGQQFYSPAREPFFYRVEAAD